MDVSKTSQRRTVFAGIVCVLGMGKRGKNQESGKMFLDIVGGGVFKFIVCKKIEKA